jgi:hypothetical protein
MRKKVDFVWIKKQGQKYLATGESEDRYAGQSSNLMLLHLCYCITVKGYLQLKTPNKVPVMN